MTLFKSSNLTSIFVFDDGRIISLTFETSKGTNLELEVQSVEMRPIIQKIMGALLQAEAKSDLIQSGDCFCDKSISDKSGHIRKTVRMC